MVDTAYHVTGVVVLTPADQKRVTRLTRLCNGYDGLDLKLVLEFPSEACRHEANAFLCTLGDAVVGYCGLDQTSPSEAEVCGMVHPAHRQRGIARELLAALRSEAARRGIAELLVICERASASGQAFVQAVGGSYRFAEHRMELDLSSHRPAQADSSVTDDGSELALLPASVSDINTLCRLRSAIFGDAPDDVRPGIESDMRDASAQYYIASLGGVPVGTLKVIEDDERAYIYGFGVAPAYRRRGLGRAMLERVFGMAREGGRSRVALEVESDNAPAVALYRAIGFRELTTYEYFAMPGTTIAG